MHKAADNTLWPPWRFKNVASKEASLNQCSCCIHPGSIKFYTLNFTHGGDEKPEIGLTPTGCNLRAPSAPSLGAYIGSIITFSILAWKGGPTFMMGAPIILYVIGASGPKLREPNTGS